MHPIVQKDKCYVSFPYMAKYPDTDYFKNRGIAGKRHKGVDFAPKKDAGGKSIIEGPVVLVSPVKGEVVFARFHKQYGNMVVIRYIEASQEYLFLLCHLDKIRNTVLKGTQIEKGEIIGTMGSTGTSTAQHLHFQVEVRLADASPTHYWVPGTFKPVNPMKYCT